MKISKSMLGLALILTSFGQARAELITCKAQVIHTPCSSGRIELAFNTDTEEFKLHMGDVTCWMGDYDVEGLVEKVEYNFPFYGGVKYVLKVDDTVLRQPVIYGELIYEAKMNVADYKPSVVVTVRDTITI